MDLLSLLVSTEQRIRLGSKPTFTVFFVSRVLYFNREKKKFTSVIQSTYLMDGRWIKLNLKILMTNIFSS
jgi:hypothetical protein